MNDLLQGAVNKLIELAGKVDEAEKAFKEAQDEYDIYRKRELPKLMLRSGIKSADLAGGGKLYIREVRTCSPNKSQILETERWLSERHGEDIVKREYKVSPKYLSDLAKADIPASEEVSVNTMSLKAFIAAGIDGGYITRDEIPEHFHWYEDSWAEIRKGE